MSLARYFSIKKSVLVMMVGLIVFGVYLYFFIGIHQILYVLKHIKSVQYVFFYSLALITVLGSVFFWSAAWNSILKSLSINISYGRAYLYHWVSYFTDLVIPCVTVCGELTRLYLVQKETQKNYGALGAVAVTNRIVAYTVVTVGLYSGAALILFKPGVPSFITNIFILFLVGETIYMGVLLYLAFAKQAARNIARLYFKLLKIFSPKRYRVSKIETTQESLANFYEGFQAFHKKPKLLVKPFILHSISYLLGLFVYVLIFYALGIPASTPVFYIVVFFITTAFQDATASFSVGSLEIFWQPFWCSME
ncbi:MAG: lysylphosphatidylglycerol synthase transmembrane domain-containing protein [Candidatus Bathyarchaeia archaeon]